ncbi:hypothetical protein EC968_003011 [Mortierella alpina]|nr:hypothetical protein EC968_003011 [Mortierella alpina]
MKLSFAVSFLGVMSLALVAGPAFALACEKECQRNVSLAFSEKYDLLSHNYFTLLSQRVQEGIFHGVPVNTMGALAQDGAIKMFNDAVSKAQRSWSATIPKTVEHAIFEDEPSFKGDCDHPFTIAQPPPGVHWTMSDCHKMDYICNNPPSICHFMPMIKKRIVKKLVDGLRARVGGVDSDVSMNFLRPAVDKLLMQENKFSAYQANLHGNLDQILESLQNVTDSFANEDQWTQDWDMEIKTLILTFP